MPPGILSRIVAAEGGETNSQASASIQTLVCQCSQEGLGAPGLAPGQPSVLSYFPKQVGGGGELTRELILPVVGGGCGNEVREVKRQGEEGVVEPQKARARERKRELEPADLGWSWLVLMGVRVARRHGEGDKKEWRGPEGRERGREVLGGLGEVHLKILNENLENDSLTNLQE